MKKKLIAALLSAAMVVSVVPVFASDAAADEETATESSTESPLAGKKIAYIMYMSSATIFQMWSDSFYRNSREAWYGSKYFLLQR